MKAKDDSMARLMAAAANPPGEKDLVRANRKLAQEVRRRDNALAAAGVLSAGRGR